ncbi:AMP-binding protein [Tianweitania sp. Rool2]|uniref:AMP-binding protein n=2 Tax=Oryzicola mucosus TaxID=2767425 RepID=A0A8J6PS37_9HYPH|nr:AMP-binding protein [Oryzicola mucosus]
MQAPFVAIGAKQRSAEEIRARAAGLAEALAALGVGRGDAVALIARNGFHFFEVETAMRSLDGFLVPLNWHLTATEAGYILRDCRARVIIGEDDLLAAINAEIPASAKQVSLEKETAGRLSYEVLAATPPKIARRGSGLESSIIYTSGTTGHPKGVRRLPKSTDEIAARRHALNLLYPSRPGARALVTGPQYHLFSLAVSMTYFGAGADVVVMERFDAESFLATIAEHRVTHTHLVPTMMVRLLRLPEDVRRRYDVSSLEFVIHSGAPCAEEIKRGLIDWFGPVISESYGSTETGAVTLIGSRDWLARPGSVGRPYATGEVRIYDKAGERLTSGGIGEIHTIMHGTPDFTYHGNDDARQRIGRDGMIASGDIGWLDAEGYLFVCDRIADMVISGGVNIYPAEIEAAILSHPAVVDAAVFGIPDPEFGESIAVHLTVAVPLVEEELRCYLRERLASYKVPKRMVFEAELPRLENGKILKRALREPYWAGRQRRV